MHRRTAFHSAFKTADAVMQLIARRDAEKQRAEPKQDGRTTREDAFAAGQELLRGGDVHANLRCIYRWKLGSFIHRFRWVRDFPDNIPNRVLIDAVKLAKKATRPPYDEVSARAALEAFVAIPGVAVPVASAFLTAMNQEKFTIIDRQAYKALGLKFRAGITEYLAYLAFCRKEANRLGITLEQHDRALWQRGVELGRQKRRRCH